MPPEAPTEVVASRLLWGVGYHQPPIYYVGKWNADEAPDKNPQLPARFRESKPDLHGLDADRPWSYYRNPFVGTRELNGLSCCRSCSATRISRTSRTRSTN